MLTAKLSSRKKKAEKSCVRDAEKNLPAGKDLNCIEKATKQILIFMANRYIFLHKMDNLFISLKHKSIYYKTNQRREPILRMRDGTVRDYSLEDETYERLVAILKRKEKTDDDVGAKVSNIEGDVKALIEQMEGIKKMLEEVNLNMKREQPSMDCNSTII